MKSLSATFLLFAIIFSSMAQIPQGIKYQAVARDNAGALLMNTPVAVRFSILDNGTSGPVLYQERQTPTTNEYGLFSLVLGDGTPIQGSFETIDWGAGSRYLQVELDPEGGTNYFDMGTNQLVSVPYALYSEKAGNVGDALQTLSVSGNTLSISNGNSVTLPGGGGSYSAGSGIDITGSTISNTAPDQTVSMNGGGTTTVSGTYPSFTVNTPAQNLSLVGNVLSISSGNSVTLPSGGGSYVPGTGINISGTTISNTAPDQAVSINGGGITNVTGTYPNFTVTSTEVPQALSFSGNQLTLSNGGGSVDLSSLQNDLDSNPINELQDITLNGSVLTLSQGGGSVTLPSGTADADADPTNELNSTLSLSGTTLSLVDGGGTLTANLSSLLNDADSDPTNELNTGVTLVGSTLNITDGGGTKSADLSSLADDADSNPTNEIQSLSLVGTTLSISSGNSVTLPSGGSSYTAGTGIDITGTTISNTAPDQTVAITGGGITNVTGTYPNFTVTSTQVPQVLSLTGSNLSLSNGGGQVTLPAGGSGGTLDDAYNFGGAGAGRTITANSGAVEVTTSSSNAAGIKVTHSNTGVAIQAISSLAGNSYPTIQATTASTSNLVAAVTGSTTGDAYAIAGQVQNTATAFAAVYGSNLRTTGGVGLDGTGFSGVGGHGNSTQGFGVFGENLNAASGIRAGGTNLAVGVGSIGFVGVLGQTAINDGAGVLGTNLGSNHTGTYDNAGVEGQGFYGVIGTSNTPALGAGLASYDNFFAVGAKNFKIDHPLDPEHKYLKHASIESNEILNFYRGNVTIDNNGKAIVTLPDYFSTININFSYQLTPVGASAPGLYISKEIEDNKFEIAGGLPGMKVSWQVLAERNDLYMQYYPEVKVMEPLKPAGCVGKYLRPELYGYGQEKAIHRTAEQQLLTVPGKTTNGQVKMNLAEQK